MLNFQSLAAFVICFLIGSVPFSFLIPKLISRVDVRKSGSGNTGATNAFRTAGIKSGILSLVGDLLKGFVPTYIGLRIGDYELACICGMAAILGHCYSIFMKGKGGKGVATGAGYILATHPLILLILLGVQCIIFFGTGYMSLASILSALAYPVLLYLFQAPPVVIGFGIVFALFLTYRHRGNIRRLLDGNENNWKKRKAAK